MQDKLSLTPSKDEIDRYKRQSQPASPSLKKPVPKKSSHKPGVRQSTAAWLLALILLSNAFVLKLGWDQIGQFEQAMAAMRDEYHQGLNQSSSQLSAGAENVSAVEKKIQALNSELSKLQEAVKKYQAQHKPEIEANKKSLEQLKADQKTTAAALQEVQKTVQKVTDSLGGLSRELAGIKRETAALDDKQQLLQGLNLKVATLEEQVMDQDVSAKLAKLAELQRQIKINTDAIQSIDDHRKQTNQQLDKILQDLRKLQFSEQPTSGL